MTPIPYHIVSHHIIATLYHFQQSENQTYKMQPFCCGGLFVRIIVDQRSVVVSLEIPGIIVSLEISGIVVSLEIP